MGQFRDDKLGGEGDGQHLPPGLHHKTSKQDTKEQGRTGQDKLFCRGAEILFIS